MKHEKLNEALNQINDKYLCEASNPKKSRPIRWIAPIAAVLALAVLVSTLFPGNTALPGAETFPTYTFTDSHLDLLVAAPEYPKLTPYPGETDFDAHELWWQEQRALHDQPAGYADNLTGYFGTLISQVLSQSDKDNEIDHQNDQVYGPEAGCAYGLTQVDGTQGLANLLYEIHNYGSLVYYSAVFVKVLQI